MSNIMHQWNCWFCNVNQVLDVFVPWPSTLLAFWNSAAFNFFLMHSGSLFQSLLALRAKLCSVNMILGSVIIIGMLLLSTSNLLETFCGMFLYKIVHIMVELLVSIISWMVSQSSDSIRLYCTVLYCTVLYCTVLYCTVLYCTVLYCTVLYCTVLYCTVLYCTVLP